MNRLMKKRIRARMTSSFIAITVITSVAAVIGVIAMLVMTTQYKNALQNYGFSQGDIGKAMVMFAETRSSLRAAVGYNTQEEIDDATKNYDTNKEKFTKYLADIEEHMVAKAGKDAYQNINDALKDYWTLSDDILQEGAVTDDALSLKAQERAINELRPAYNKVYNAMKDLMNVNVDKGNATQSFLVTLEIVLIVVMILIIAVAVFFALRVGRAIANSIEGPLLETSERIKTFARGDLDSPFPEMETKDEIYDMLQDVKEMAVNLNDIITDMGHLLSEMAEGNFAINTQIEEKYVGKFEVLITSIRKMNRKMDTTLRQVDDASIQVSAGSGNLAEAAEALADGATEQAGAIEELQATIADVTNTVENTAKELQDSYENAQKYANDAGQSRVQMQETVKAMERISESSQKIENIISELEDIASQTNLLSLNASIEAARAGEAGKGFAVVADQIRNLAEQSATSAVSTRELIEGSLYDVNEGNKAVEAVSSTLDEVVNGMTSIADTAKTLSDKSLEQAKTMEQVELGVNQISEVVQSNSAAAQETSATSEELSAQAETLETLVNQFQLREQ